MRVRRRPCTCTGTAPGYPQHETGCDRSREMYYFHDEDAVEYRYLEPYVALPPTELSALIRDHEDNINMRLEKILADINEETAP